MNKLDALPPCVVMQHIDDKEYCTPREAIEYAKKIKDKDVWEVVLARKDLEPAEAIKCLEKIDFYEIQEIILARKDVKPAVAIRWAQKLHDRNRDDNVWWKIINRDDVKNYFNTLALTEAIECAKKLGNPFWKIVLARKDLKPAEAIEWAKKLNQYGGYWKIVLAREDIKPTEAIECAREVNDGDVWEVVLARKDLKPAEAIECAKKAENTLQVWEIQKVWMAALKREDVNLVEVFQRTNIIEDKNWGEIFALREEQIKPVEALECARQLNRDIVWNNVLYREDVKNYLNTLVPTQALEYAKQINRLDVWKIVFAKNRNVWREMFTRKDLKPTEAIEWAKKINDEDVWEVVLARKDVNPIEAIELVRNGKAFYCHKVFQRDWEEWHTVRDNRGFWEIVFARKDLKPAEAIKYAKEIDGNYIWQIVLERKDVINYLNTLTLAEAIKYAKKINNRHIWDIVHERRDVRKYLR